MGDNGHISSLIDDLPSITKRKIKRCSSYFEELLLDAHSAVFIHVLFVSLSHDLTLWCRCDISDPEVWTGYWCRTHILPQSWDLGQGEHYFIPVLRL